MQKLLTLAIAALLAILLWQPGSHVLAQTVLPGETLPELQVHPLPSTLAQWQDPESRGDYFDQVSQTAVGYLVWSEFPVKVFVEPPNLDDTDRSRVWAEAVSRAVQEWSQYLPLEQVDAPEAASIRVWRRSPPLRGWGDRLQRVRSAETRYQLYVRRRGATSEQSELAVENQAETTPAILSHRCEVWLRPSQTADYIQAAARHELGHALGIWGHSSLDTDALYFSQVRNPATISARDINTLKRIYQQPTRLGWTVEQ